MSSKISEKTSDAKVTVSSDSDDDTSSSSLLSSSAPSEEESDVETVTFSVSLPPQDKAKHAEMDARKEPTANDSSRKLEPQPNKAAYIDKSGGAARSSLSPNKAEVAETGNSKALLSGASGLKKILAKPDESKVTKATTANAQRSISPKIVVNDVGSAEGKTESKRSADNSKKTGDKSPVKTVSETSNADLSCSASPLKNLNNADRSKSPQKTESKAEIESTKSVKKIAGVISSLEAGQKSPRISPSRKTPEEILGGNPKSSQEEKEAERSKSPKKLSGEKEVSREISPKKTSIIDSKEAVGETSPRNSSKEPVPGEAKKKSDKETAKDDLIKTQNSPTGYTKTKLEPKQENPDTETAKAKTKKTKTPKQEDDDVKDDVQLTKSRVTQVENDSKNVDTVLRNKGKTSLHYNGLAQESNEEGKPGLTKSEPNRERQGRESEPNVTDNIDVRKTKTSEVNKPVESGNDVTNLPKPDTGRTDGQKTPKKTEIGSDGVDSDTSHPSKSSNDDLKTTENTKELVNEDSEFTYRRKSMDDFIKRILAEAREEKLKQQQGAKGEPAAARGEAEEGRNTEGYREQNGGISNETPGLPPKLSRSVPVDKEASNLDKRLASIEKRRFGDGESAKGGRSKVKGEGEEESAVKKKPLQNDVNDFDINLEDDLMEINRYLQSRKTASATRFEDEDEDLENSSTAGKQRRWLSTDANDQTAPLTEADDANQTKSSQTRKKLISDFIDNNDDDDDRILARFKRERDRERDLVLPEALFAPRRRDVTDDVIRERTRSVRGLVDGQTGIVQSFKNSSKGLEDLEREIRAVRQICLDRQARIEALDGALNAEFRAYETDHLAACERLNATADAIATPREDYGGGRLRRQGRIPGRESIDEDSFPSRRRSICAPGVGGYGPTPRSSDLGIDLPDLRPSSRQHQQQQQQRGSDTRGSESDYQPVDPRRRAGSAGRDWATDPLGGLDDPGLMLAQRSARTRASIATSNPTADYADSGAASSDNFLARIRAKYSFLAPSVDNSGYSGSTRSSSSRGPASSSNYGTGSLLSTSDFKYTRPRSGLEDTKQRTRDFLTTASPLSSYGSSYAPSYYSVRDSRSPGRGSRGGLDGGTTAYSFDRPAGPGSEFHSRFLDKVRGKKAMGEEAPAAAAAKGGQDRPFKSRFLKGSPGESASSRSDRATEGGGGGGEGAAEAEAGQRSEVIE